MFKPVFSIGVGVIVLLELSYVLCCVHTHFSDKFYKYEYSYATNVNYKN